MMSWSRSPERSWLEESSGSSLVQMSYLDLLVRLKGAVETPGNGRVGGSQATPTTIQRRCRAPRSWRCGTADCMSATSVTVSHSAGLSVAATVNQRPDAGQWRAAPVRPWSVGLHFLRFPCSCKDGCSMTVYDRQVHCPTLHQEELYFTAQHRLKGILFTLCHCTSRAKEILWTLAHSGLGELATLIQAQNLTMDINIRLIHVQVHLVYCFTYNKGYLWPEILTEFRRDSGSSVLQLSPWPTHIPGDFERGWS